MTYGALVVGCLIVLVPIGWALSTSLKISQEIHSWPPHWIPHQFTFENYLQGPLTKKFLTYLGNSVFIVAATVLLSVGLACHAAYAVARKNFSAKKPLLVLVWATMMIPTVSIVVPLYLMAVDVGIYDTYLVLVLVYSAWLIPSTLWLLTGFVESVPVELEEAAQIDGCGPFKIFYAILLPLMRPGLAAAAVLVFVTVWNDFLIGFSLVLSDSRRLLQVGLQVFLTEGGIEWGPMMAATITALIPAALVFGVLQRAFVQGLTGGAVKG
jgi:ABC-type glycerol-3-phosphate transport system permease component